MLYNYKQIPVDPGLKSLLAGAAKDIGPVSLYSCDPGLPPDGVLLTGTAFATGTKIVTGIGTLFLTELKPGDWLTFETALTSYRIKSIEDDLSLTLYENVTTAPTPGEAIYREHLIKLGETANTQIMFSVGKAELKSSQRGDAPDDRAVSAWTCSVQFGLVSPNADQIQQVLQGLNNVFDDDGNLTSQFWTPKLGERDRAVARQLFLVRLLDGAGTESEDPLDVMRFYQAAPAVEAEVARNPTEQVVYPVVMNCYIDETTGRVWALGDLT